MAHSKKVDGLEIHEDMKFQKRSWIVQRVGWAIIALLVLLAALGLFGDGVLSEAIAGQQGAALWVEYPRFARFEQEIHLRVHSNGGAVSEGQTTLQISQDYMQNMQVDNVSPKPQAESNDSDWLTYRFQTSAPSLTADFYFRPHKVGWFSGSFRLQNGETVTLSQFIYP